MKLDRTGRGNLLIFILFAVALGCILLYLYFIDGLSSVAGSSSIEGGPLYVSTFLALVGGLLSAFSPCVLPIAPVVFAGSVGHRFRPLAIVTGMGATFTSMGVIVSLLGVSLGFSNSIVRYLFVIAISFFGLQMLFPGLKTRVFRGPGFFDTAGLGFGQTSLLGGFIVGASLGFVWVPCVGPVLGSILALAAIQGAFVRGSVLLAFYSLGISIPLLAIAYGGKTVGSSMEVFREHGSAVERVAGAVLVVTAVAIALGLDAAVQSLFL